MDIDEKIKIRTAKIIKDFGGDIQLIARYGARFSILFENSRYIKQATLDQALDEMRNLIRDKQEVFDCEMCGAVPCGMGCHDNYPTD